MDEHAQSAQTTGPLDVEAEYHDVHHHPNYVRVWGILVVLLVVSVLGPLLGHPVVTLITAFGIAVVKAYLVARNFMHINLAPRYVVYLVGTCLVFMLLFFAGVAPDVMKVQGVQWEKPGWIAANASYDAAHPEHGELGQEHEHGDVRPAEH
jgi:caa(3)-type oxidase subunit IV